MLLIAGFALTVAATPASAHHADVSGYTACSNGVHVEFSKKQGAGRWPDFTPRGWDGPLQYTLGMVLSISGQLYASAPIEFWTGLDAAGGPPSQYRDYIEREERARHRRTHDQRNHNPRSHNTSPISC